MKLSKTTKCLLICLLIVLVIVIRLPSYPHERGSPDEFTFHALANSVSEFGYAKWWMNPLCIFGLYPYAYVSAPPFLFSGVSQCTGMDMESCAWLLSTILGIFIMLSAYMMAGQIRNDDTFKFLVAFFVSISPGILAYTTWQVSARGMFLAFLPLFIYSVLTIRNFAARFSVLVLVLLVFLLSVHHYVYFTLPIIISFVVVVAICKMRTTGILNKIRVSQRVSSVFLVTAFLVAFSIPFFTRTFIQGSRYDALHQLLESSVRYSGPLLLIAVGGVIYLICKRDKEFGELFLVMSLIFFAPLMYIGTYYPYFGAVVLCMYVGVGMANIAEVRMNKKRAFTVMVVCFLIFSGFSTFYQHGRTNVAGHQSHKFYMSDSTYNTGMWIKDHLQEGRMVSNGIFITPTRMLSVSEVPLLSMPCTDLVYGFVNVSEEIKVVKNSPLSTKFYMDNPYVLSTEVQNPWYCRLALQNLDIESNQCKPIITKKNLSHVVEIGRISDNPFTSSIHKGEYDKVFSNEMIHIWNITNS